MLRAAFRRLFAVDEPPERTALAFSVGVFIGFSPFLGLHTVVAAVVAIIFRLNKTAIFIGVYLNNPLLTLVPIVLASYAVGAFLLGQPLKPSPADTALLTHAHPFDAAYRQQLWERGGDLLWPYLVGGMILCSLCALAAYPLTWRALRARQAAKSPVVSEPPPDA